MALPDWQQRVVDERDQLDDRLQKLRAFFKTPQFEKLPEDDQRVLRQQSVFMGEYLSILEYRISKFV